MERPNASGRGVGRWLCMEWQDVPQPVEDRPGHHRHPLERTPVLWFARQTVEGAAVMKTRGSKKVRCAIYTRVSTDQGLEQEFNSLDAQYDASQAYNRLAEKGDWDLDQLKVEFEELIIEDAPIEVCGFTLDEIDQIIADEADVIEQGPLRPDESAVAVAHVGDMFELGPHRVVCGDATDPAVLRLLMGDDCEARLILTDEPYNVPIAFVSVTQQFNTTTSMGRLTLN